MSSKVCHSVICAGCVHRLHRTTDECVFVVSNLASINQSSTMHE